MAKASAFRDGLLLAVGTLTTLRVPPPVTVDQSTARVAMLAAPIATIPLAASAALLAWLGSDVLELNALVVGFMVVGCLALGTRALHLDGLADVADALTASHDRERSLAVMKDPSVGPAGAVALILVLGLQASAIASLATLDHGWAIVAFVICASRSALTIGCTTVVPSARDTGLGAALARSVPVPAALLVIAIVAATAWPVYDWIGLDAWRGPVAVAAGLIAAALVLAHAVRRVGGMTGDVLGASVEICLATTLAVSTATFLA